MPRFSIDDSVNFTAQEGVGALDDEEFTDPDPLYSNREHMTNPCTVVEVRKRGTLLITSNCRRALVHESELTKAS